jgi:hypothetical protein
LVFSHTLSSFVFSKTCGQDRRCIEGSNYEKLIEDLQMTDEGQYRIFGALLSAAVDFIRYLRTNLLPKDLE